MSDARWIEVRADIQSAVRHFDMSKKLFERKGFDEDSAEAYIARMAIMHSMQAGYTSLEIGIKRILNILDEALPNGDEWHLDLLKRSARIIKNSRPAILSKDTYKLADEARRFWYAAVNDYDDFVPFKSEKAIEAADKLSKVLIYEVDNFIKVIDPEK